MRLYDGSRVLLRAKHKDQFRAYDFVTARTHGGRRLLVIVDEFNGECPSIDIARSLTSDDVPERPEWSTATRGLPQHIRSDIHHKMTAKSVRDGLTEVRVTTLYIDGACLGRARSWRTSTASCGTNC